MERTFGWLGRYRLLAKDYAATIAFSEAEIHLAMTHLMLNRLTHQVPENEYRRFRQKSRWTETVERTPSSVRVKFAMTLTNGRRRPFYRDSCRKRQSRFASAA